MADKPKNNNQSFWGLSAILPLAATVRALSAAVPRHTICPAGMVHRGTALQAPQPFNPSFQSAFQYILIQYLRKTCMYVTIMPIIIFFD
jgi:hypothetical protein